MALLQATIFAGALLTNRVREPSTLQQQSGELGPPHHGNSTAHLPVELPHWLDRLPVLRRPAGLGRDDECVPHAARDVMHLDGDALRFSFSGCTAPQPAGRLGTLWGYDAG